MGSFAFLRIDGYELVESKNHPFQYGAPEWMTIFRDSDRLPRRRVYECLAAHARDRLEVMGFTLRRTNAAYDRARRRRMRELRQFKTDLRAEIRLLARFDLAAWMQCFARMKRDGITPPYGGLELKLDPVSGVLVETPEWDETVGDFGFPSIDPRYFLRAVVEAVEGRGRLSFNYSELVTAGWWPRRATPCAAAERSLSGDPSAGRIVLLTEGRSDRRALEGALSVLAPHLMQYFAFFDFDASSAEGGAGALVRMIRAFIGAGITNRVVAIFDNDTGAHAALAPIRRQGSIPSNYRLIQLPHLPLGRAYPTVGPSGVTLENINGRAASIELYFGEDVLRRVDGSLAPVQWTSLDSGVGSWQGNVMEKGKLQRAFAHKIEAWRGKAVPPDEPSWDGMRRVIRTLSRAFTDAAPEEC
jgi:hypothetical protein